MKLAHDSWSEAAANASIYVSLSTDAVHADAACDDVEATAITDTETHARDEPQRGVVK